MGTARRGCSLKGETWTLLLQHGSYSTLEYSLRLGDKDTVLTLAMSPVLYRMPERLATAVAEPTQPGVTSLAPTEVTRYPSPVPDPLRILRALPGVASGGDQAVFAWGDDKLGVDLFRLRGRSGFALQPEGRTLRYDCGANPPQPPRGCCDQSVGTAFGLQGFEHDLDLVGTRIAWRVGPWRWQLRGHHLRRQEREDMDETYLADRIPKSFTPRAISRDWLETRSVATGRLQQDQSEWSLALAPVEGDGWELGGGSRRTEIDASRVATDTLWLAGEVLTATTVDQVVQRTRIDHFAFGRRIWTLGAWTAATELRAVRFDDPDELLWLPKFRLARTIGTWRLALATGLTAQPPLYKELLSRTEGVPDTQKGADATLELEQQTQNMRWRSALFYRRGWDRISFTVKDVELRYAPDTDSRTRAWGAETQVRGQIGRAVGTVSYSFLSSRENLDSTPTGWLPTATDQRHTASAYLEDRMDLRMGWLQASRFHIRLLLGSGFPYTPQIPVIDDDGVITALVDGARHAQRDDAESASRSA
jgi:hypothetical protein